jgi:hypothetical protein
MTAKIDNMNNRPQVVTMSRFPKPALLVLTLCLLGATANEVASHIFPAHWGGPNIGAGMLQLLFYIGIAASLAVITSGVIKRRR